MTRKQQKVIISCAVTGSVHTPTMSPALPVTPEEIAQASLDAHEAGAAVIHLHARDPRDGRPTADPAIFMQFLPRIAERSLGLPAGSPPPIFAATVISFASLEKSCPLFWSRGPLMCLTLDHLL